MPLLNLCAILFLILFGPLLVIWPFDANLAYDVELGWMIAIPLSMIIDGVWGR